MLVRDLNDTPELRAAGADLGGITEVSVRTTQALLDPTRRPAHS